MSRWLKQGLGFWYRLRCRIGWHEWIHFRMSPEYRKAFPETSQWGRECVLCNKLQYPADDKRSWDNGIRGNDEQQKI
jgi:hypothetical protein